MKKTISVTHVTDSNKADFGLFLENFENQLGRHNFAAYQPALNDKSRYAEVEKILKSQEGSSGFMVFTEYDHGRLLNIKGKAVRAVQYILGNPLFASQMTMHNIAAGLYAPLRVLIYSSPDSTVTVEYDLPSSLFGQFENEKIDGVARDLDAKMEKLISQSFEKSAPRK